MKKFCYSLIYASVLIFCSCSNAAKMETEEYNTETIKSLLENRENVEIQWAKELEKNRLTSYTRKSDLTSKDINVNRENCRIISGYADKVFPQIDGFGKLDTSKLKSIQKKNIKTFCDNLCSLNDSETKTLFSENYFYNYIFFKNDLKKNWNQKFNVEFPVINDENKNKLFDSYIIGEPFIGENIIQVPVCFYCKQGFIDVTLFIEDSEKSNILKIKIEKWGNV